MAAARGRLRRSDRLRSSKDFRRVSREGVRRRSRHFVLLLAPAGDLAPAGQAHLGITVSRKVGNAVTRNRVKRGIREWFRGSEPRLPGDWVVIARPGAGALASIEIQAELAGMWG